MHLIEMAKLIRVDQDCLEGPKTIYTKRGKTGDNLIKIDQKGQRRK